ncbi:hypothetical protein JCM18903_731 [Psychrobacter sp. JCM 18903]|nr:hypothetical protein JCM18903_731 [Psychrobacter sp. JCM 18903]
MTPDIHALEGRGLTALDDKSSNNRKRSAFEYNEVWLVFHNSTAITAKIQR